MTKFLALSVLLGMDNLRATVGLGMLGLDRGVRRRLALSFGIWEAAAPVAGFALGRAAPAMEWVAPAALAACAVLVLVGAAHGADVGRWLGTRTAIVLLPGLLALDNLAAGIGLGSAGAAVAAAVVAGSASAIWSFVGLSLGGRLGRLPLPATALAGGLLLGSAVLAGLT